MEQPRGADDTIGGRLRRLRLERGLSQRELAGPGVSHAYISRIEGGQRRPSFKAVRQLARRLGVSIDQLEAGRRLSASEERQLQIADAELELRLDGDLESAEELFRTLAGDDETESEVAARAMAGLGLIAARRGDRREATTLLDQAVATGHLPSYLRPDVYEELAQAYSFLDETRRAIDVLERALEDARAHASGDIVEMRLIAYLGCAYADGVDPRRAKRLLYEAEARIEALPSTQARVRVYWALARLVWWNELDPDKALGYARKALGLYKSTEDTRGLALAHLLYAQLLNLERKWQEAARHLARAETMLASSGMSRSKEFGVIRAEQAKSTAWAGRGDDAIALANEANKLLGDEPLQQGLKWHAYAAAYAARNDRKRAESFYKRTLDFLEQHGQGRAAAMVAREWATLCRSRGEMEKALDLLERAAGYRLVAASTD